MADETDVTAPGELPFNQAELAEKLGVTQPTISRWFSGERKMPVEVCKQIADITGLSMDRIAGLIKPVSV